MEMNRREFVKGLGAAAGAAAIGGCRSLFGGRAFYGPTIRDRLWMWGHHKDAVKVAGWGFSRHGFKDGFVDQAEGCRLMGIPNDCVIRCAELPRRPWGDYFEQFRALKRFTFGITDGGLESTEEKMHIAFDELKPNFPNFTGCFLDDFFTNKDLNKPYERLVSIADQVHDRGLRLSVVLYADEDGFKETNRASCALCDEVSLWFWRQANIVKLFDDVKRCRDYVGPDKDILLGLYMWEFADKGKPMSAALMEKQLDFARRLLADRTVSGLIFHPTFVANLDLEAVKLSKAWIKANADDLWGV